MGNPMDTPRTVRVTIVFDMELDASSLSWIEEVKDKVREQAGILSAQMTGVPPVIDLGT